MVIDLLLVAVWVAGILLSRKLYRDVFTPLGIYLSMWMLCLLLFRVRLVNYYELETRTILLIGGSLGAFVFGCLIAHRRVKSRTPKFDLSHLIEVGSLESVIKILILLNFVGALIFMYQMNSTYGLSTYFTDPAVIRRDFAEWTRVGSLGFLMMLDFPLLVACWIHYLLTKKLRWFSLLVLPLVTAQTFLKTDRGSLTIYAITCISLWIFWNDWRTLTWRMIRRLGVSLVLLLAYFIAIGSLYGKLVSMQLDAFDLSDLTVTSQVGLVLVTPYIYATSPIAGFQEAMADVGRHSWGTRSFFPVARLLYAVGVLDERPEAYNFAFYRVPIPVNTYTHLYAFYEDFGVPGVLLLPMILGYLQTRLYLRMKGRPSLFSLAGSSAFTALNAFSVFVPLMTGISFWYYFGVIYVISRYCQFPEPAVTLQGALGPNPRTV